MKAEEENPEIYHNADYNTTENESNQEQYSEDGVRGWSQSNKDRVCVICMCTHYTNLALANRVYLTVF